MLQKNKVKTVVVMTTCNDRKIVLDQIDAIKWSCDESFEIVVVDDKGGLELPCTVLRSQSKLKGFPFQKGAFKVNEGIQWSLKNIDFDMVMVLDDDALPIGKGLDTWALNKFKKNPKIGMIGTKDDIKACSLYREPMKVKMMMEQLSKWHSIENWTPPPEVIFYAVNFQSRALVEKLNIMGMLDVEKEIWSMPCETFQSWVTNLAGFDLEFCGRYPNELTPPLYSMHHGSVKPEDPRRISSEFLVHHSIKQSGVDEWTIRKHFKMKRMKIF
jgi:hypothetical protein